MPAPPPLHRHRSTPQTAAITVPHTNELVASGLVNFINECQYYATYYLMHKWILFATTLVFQNKNFASCKS